jgi:hypothetical protein
MCTRHMRFVELCPRTIPLLTRSAYVTHFFSSPGFCTRLTKHMLTQIRSLKQVVNIGQRVLPFAGVCTAACIGDIHLRYTVRLTSQSRDIFHKFLFPQTQTCQTAFPVMYMIAGNFPARHEQDSYGYTLHNHKRWHTWFVSVCMHACANLLVFCECVWLQLNGDGTLSFELYVCICVCACIVIRHRLKYSVLLLLFTVQKKGP